MWLYSSFYPFITISTIYLYKNMSLCVEVNWLNLCCLRHKKSMAKHHLYLIPFILLMLSCNAQTSVEEKPVTKTETADTTKVLSAVEQLYNSYKSQTGVSSSLGKVNEGSLKNGYPVPFSGKNFCYFDTTSYLNKRAFVNDKVKSALLQTYDSLDKCSDVYFGLMECSNEEGGKIWPHRTHQNGLSCDFMMPLLKNGIANTELNNLGAQHYLMNFSDDGIYEDNSEFSIDFNTMALHLLILQEMARKNHLVIDKVILKIALKDNLFATPNGKKLKESGIYFATKLSPLIDNLHDDHYHVDFKVTK